MIVASGGIGAAISLTSTVFAKCGLGTQDIHCWGQSPPASGAKAGNFKCKFFFKWMCIQVEFSIWGGRCMGDLFGPTHCVGQLKSLIPCALKL